jgi:hypothetical protein
MEEMTESTQASKPPFPDFPGERKKSKAADKQEPCHCNAMTMPHHHTATGIEAVKEEES